MIVASSNYNLNAISTNEFILPNCKLGVNPNKSTFIKNPILILVHFELLIYLYIYLCYNKSFLSSMSKVQRIKIGC